MYRILLPIFFTLSFFIVKSQRANNWYFGANAGLNFSTTPASTLSSGAANNPDNTSTISDVNGNLLFYTNGVNVWNSQHSVMPNGSGLTGHTSAGQCALIVPIPCDPNKYVIFHVTEFSNPGYLHYSVVDMALNGGLGDVVASQKNVSLGTGWTEKLCAYYDVSANRYWLVSHKWNSNQFVAFEVNSTSIATNSVVSSIGSVLNCGSYGAAHDAMGQLTISPDGTKIINALTCADKYELFDFNSSTGVVSNSISITGTGGNAWGTAFSPDSKKVYTNTIFGLSVLQYDINTYSQSAILATQYSVVTVSTSGYNFGYMELGPDNKLYIAKPSTNSISVVNNPNGAGSACNFSIAGQSLGNKSSNHGLSRIAYNIPPGIGTFSISSSPNSTLGCTTQTLTLTASPTLSALSYTWSGPGIIGSTNSQTIQVNAAGIYTCSLPVCPNTISSRTFAVSNFTTIPTISISPSSLSLCPGVTPTLAASGATSYTWQPGNIVGATVTLVSPSVSTIYTVTGTTTLGCLTTKTVLINVYPQPTVFGTPLSPTICSGESLTLVPSGALNYTLSPWGIVVANGGQFVLTPTATSVYTLIGAGIAGCTASISNTMIVNAIPSLSISPSTNTVCFGSSFTYTASGALNYTWSPGNTNGSIYSINSASINSQYTLNGISAQGCTASVIRGFTVVPTPTVSASSNPTSTCAGGNVTLTSTGANNYTWQPGSLLGQSITVNPLTTTIYTVFGEANGCISNSSVIVANPLSPTLTSSGDLDCLNTSVTLIISANSSTYSNVWSGPGVSGVVTSSVISVTLPGIYTSVLTDTITGCSSSSTVNVNNVMNLSSLSIIPSNTLACYPGPPINLMISSSANYTWFPSTQVSPSNGPLVSVNPSVTSTYTVLATLGVCSGSAAVTISVNPTPLVQPSVTSLTMCEGTTATLVANGANNYQWNPGNILVNSPVVSPPSTTIYTVTGISNNCSSVNTLTVVVLPAPTLTSAIYPSVICIGNSATLSAGGSPTIMWASNNFTSNLPTSIVNPFVSSTYTAIGTNSLGCSKSLTVNLTVNSGPSLIPFVSDSLLCSGATATLSASGATTYTWFPGNLIGASIVISPSVSTTYTVVSSALGCSSYTTTNVVILNCVKPLFGVTNAAAEPIFTKGTYYLIHFTVTAVNSSQQDLTNVRLTNSLPSTFPFPSTYTVVNAPKIISKNSQLVANDFYNGSSELSLTLPQTSTLLAGKRDTLEFSVLLDPKGVSGTFKNWVIGYADLFNSQTLSDTSNAGFAWDPDNDGNPNNNNEATLLKIDLIELFIPEGFSPNSDGINDLFEIKGLNDRKVNLSVFNRWGNKVYQQDNYVNNWDGKVNVNSVQFGNGKLPEGTYYYVLQFEDGKTETITGFIELNY